MKISSKGEKNVIMGAIYREHCLIRQPDPNNTGHISQWVAASARADTIVIGDINLDINKWENPD